MLRREDWAYPQSVLDWLTQHGEELLSEVKGSSTDGLTAPAPAPVRARTNLNEWGGASQLSYSRPTLYHCR